MAIKITVQATIEGNDAPSPEALNAIAIAFFNLRSAISWGEDVVAKYETSTAAERDVFRRVIHYLAANAPAQEQDAVKALRDKIEARDSKKNDPPITPIIPIDDDVPLMRPTVKTTLVSEPEN